MRGNHTQRVSTEGTRVNSMWRRTAAPPLHLPQPIVDFAVPLRGVGRIPTEIDTDLALVTYVDAAKTYDYRRLDASGNVLWSRSLPSGGYSSVAYNRWTGRLCGPTSYHALVELDWDTGKQIASFDLGRRVRSSPVALPNSEDFVAAVGNRIHRFSAAAGLRHLEYPGHVHFGRPAVAEDGSIITAGAHRSGDGAVTTLSAFDPDTLRVLWRTVVGDGFVPSSDSSGVTAAHGRILATAPGGVVVALDAHTGEILWRTRLTADRGSPLVHRSRPVVLPPYGQHEGGVVVTSLQGEVVLLSPADGAVTWRTVPDRAAGIWSPATVRTRADGSPEIVVHAGVLLVGLDPSSGDIRWTLPIGFDAYTQVVSTTTGRLVVCGGDPPDDGYLIGVSPDALRSPDERAAASAEHRWGHDLDQLTIELRAPGAEKVTADLRMFGRSGSEQFRADGTGAHVWRGTVSTSKRRADTAVLASVTTAGRASPLPIYIDAGSTVRPTEPRALAFDPENLPRPQPNRTDSGGVVVSAILRTLGRNVSPDMIESMAETIRGRDVDPHFVWRGGTERILMAGGSALTEDGVARPTPADVIDAWKRSH